MVLHTCLSWCDFFLLPKLALYVQNKTSKSAKLLHRRFLQTSNLKFNTAANLTQQTSQTLSTNFAASVKHVIVHKIPTTCGKNQWHYDADMQHHAFEGVGQDIWGFRLCSVGVITVWFHV